MNQKCHILQGSSTTACSMKILLGERANEFGRTQRETERRQKFLRTIFAFITLETTKVIGRVLPSTNHLLFYDGPCDLSVAYLASTTLKSAFFRAKTVTPKSSVQPPYNRRLSHLFHNTHISQHGRWIFFPSSSCILCFWNFGGDLTQSFSAIGELIFIFPFISLSEIGTDRLRKTIQS